MADQTLGRFIFDFIVNTGGLDAGLEQSTKKSNDLAETIRTLITLFDVLELRMNNTGMSAKQTAEASELLANTNKRVSESNEDLTVALNSLQEKFDELADSQKKASEQGDKTDKQRDKQERGISSFTKKLLAMALAYVSVNKVAGGFKTSFSKNMEIAKLTALLDINANSVKNWINIVEDVGGDPGSVIETFKNIATQLGQIDITGEGNKLLTAVNKLGVKIKDELNDNLPSDEILINILAKIQSKDLTKEQIKFLTESVGISEDIVLATRGLDRQGIIGLLKETQDETRNLSKEDTERFLKLNKGISDVKQAATDLFTDIGLDNLDLALEVLTGIKDVLNDIRGDDIDFSVEAFGGAANEAFKDVMNFLAKKAAASTEERQQFLSQDTPIETNVSDQQKIELMENKSSAENKFNGIPIDFNDPTTSEEEKMRMFEQTSTALPGTSVNNIIDKSVTISGLSFSSPALTTEGAATDFVTQVERIINGKFTQASETLSNSVIG